MKTHILTVICFLGLQILGGFQVQAAITEQRIFDEAQLFSQEEAELLMDTIEFLQDLMAADVIVATIDDARGYSTFDFADRFYDEYDFGIGIDNSGVLFLIDMDNREFDILTEGMMIDYLTDARIEAILDEVYGYIVYGDFYGGANAFLTLVRAYYEDGLVEGQYRLTDQRVFDNIELFSEREVQDLAGLINSLENIMDMDIFVLSVDKISEKVVHEFYEEMGLSSVDNSDVILVLDGVQYEIVSRGEMAQYLNSSRLDSIADSLNQALASGNFYEATELFLNQVKAAYEAGLPVAPLTIEEVLAMLLISGAIGFLFYRSVVRKYEKIEKKQSSSAYNNHLNLKKEKDVFLHRRVSKTRLPKDPPPSNSGSSGKSSSRSVTRSTTRTSSSGRSRGGGGRSF